MTESPEPHKAHRKRKFRLQRNETFVLADSARERTYHQAAAASPQAQPYFPSSPPSPAVSYASPTSYWPVPREMNAKPPARLFVRILRDRGLACARFVSDFETSAVTLHSGCVRFGRVRCGTENDDHRRSDRPPCIHGFHDACEDGGLGTQDSI